MYPMMRRAKLSEQLEYDIEPKTEEDKALHASLRAKLKALVDQPFTNRGLVELQTMAQLTRSILIAGKKPQAAQRMAQGPVSALTGEPFNLGDYAELDDGLGPIAPAPPLETFGSQISRELVSTFSKLGDGIGKKRESLSDLVSAIATAQREGLTDIANELRARLRGERDAPVTVRGELGMEMESKALKPPTLGELVESMTEAVKNGGDSDPPLSPPPSPLPVEDKEV